MAAPCIRRHTIRPTKVMPDGEQVLSKTQIYVSNLPPEVSDERLRAAFESCGVITDAFVPVRGRRLRFGCLGIVPPASSLSVVRFVTFESSKSLKRGLKMDGKYLDSEHSKMSDSDTPIKVVVAAEKPEVSVPY